MPEVSSSEEEWQEQHNKEELYEQEEQDKQQQQEEPESASHTEPKTPKHDNGEDADTSENDYGLTVDVLKAMLNQDAINEDDMNKIITYPQKKRNKKKRTLIRRLRDKFKF